VDFTEWLTVPQTARWLGVNITTAYAAIKRGRIEVLETPLGLLCNRASVDAYDSTRRSVRHRGERLVVAS
jgi:hypothetical protein